MIFKLDELTRVAKERGLTRALTHSFRYISPLHSHHESYQEYRVDNLDRANIIRSKIQPEDETLLDIGCADAVLTAELAKSEELFCLGVEQIPRHLESGQNNLSECDNAGIINVKLGPDNINLLPEFDITLMLTVYQHFVHSHTYSEYRKEGDCGGSNVLGAEHMLRVIATKTDKIFFEIWDRPPGKDFGTDRFNFDTDNTRTFWPKYFNFILDKNVDVEYLGKTNYKIDGEGRNDIHFLLETRNYTHH